MNEPTGSKPRTVEPPNVDASEGADNVDTKDVDLSHVHAGTDDGKATATPAPEPDDAAIGDAKELAEDIDSKYQPDARESVVLPGTDGTVSGTAIADWLDEDGNIIDPDDRTGAT